MFCTKRILGSVKVVGLLKNNRHVHLVRWFSHIESLESTQLALATLIGEFLSPHGNNQTSINNATQRQSQTKLALIRPQPLSRLVFLTPRRAKLSLVSLLNPVAICISVMLRLLCSISISQRCTRVNCLSDLTILILQKSACVSSPGLFGRSLNEVSISD
jgi:hypothetical protein